MLEPIRDCQNHLVCFADAFTGQIVSKYKKQITKTIIPVGGEFIIIRDETETVIKRINDSELNVSSYQN